MEIVSLIQVLVRFAKIAELQTPIQPQVSLLHCAFVVRKRLIGRYMWFPNYSIEQVKYKLFVGFHQKSSCLSLYLPQFLAKEIFNSPEFLVNSMKSTYLATISNNKCLLTKAFRVCFLNTPK